MSYRQDERGVPVQLGLDEAVDVLGVGLRDPFRVGGDVVTDLAQRRGDAADLVLGEHAGAAERVRPRAAALEVRLEQPVVERQAAVEPLEERVEPAAEPRTPELGHRVTRSSPSVARGRRPCRAGRRA